jgi:methyl-accepting chemotaxis protein
MNNVDKKRTYFWFIGGFVAPPSIWLFLCWFSGLMSSSEVLSVALSPMLAAYVIAYVTAITMILHKKIKAIENYYSSKNEETLSAAQRSAAQIPLLFIFGNIIYAILGPNAGLFGKPFLTSSEYLTAWLFGVPLTLAYAIPFFVYSTSSLEKWACAVPMPKAGWFLSVKARTYFVTFTTSIGMLMVNLIFVYSMLQFNANMGIDDIVTKLIVLGLLGAGSLLIALVPFIGQISKQIGRMKEFAAIVAEGDLQNRVELEERDEIGELATSLNDMIDYMSDTAQAAKQISAGDLMVQLQPKGENDILGNALVDMVVKLKTLIRKIQESSEQVVAASEEISSGSEATATGAQQIAQGAERQSATVEQTSASIEQMSASIQQVAASTQQQNVAVQQISSVVEHTVSSLQEIATKAKDVAEGAENAATEAKEGGKSIAQTVEVMKQIGTSSERIGEIISVITEISEQINLLALNAAIEAARAGEHGRGFAVVAEGVTKLAARSQEAAKEISNVIKQTSSIIDEGSRISDKAGEAMEKILANAENATSQLNILSDVIINQATGSEQVLKSTAELGKLTAQITTAAEQQANGSNEVVKAVNILNDISQQNATIAEEASTQAEEASSATEELVAQAQLMQKAASVFRAA